jgi:hypothetical protein
MTSTSFLRMQTTSLMSSKPQRTAVQTVELGIVIRNLCYNNTDGRRITIGIAGDRQMKGKKLGAFCSVTSTQLGLLLGIFHQHGHLYKMAYFSHIMLLFCLNEVSR